MSYCLWICIIKSELLAVFLIYAVKMDEKLKNYSNPVIHVMSHLELQLSSPSSNTKDFLPP